MIYLICYADSARCDLLGIYVFHTFRQLVQWSDGFISYNDFNRPSAKKKCFHIVKHEDRRKAV